MFKHIVVGVDGSAGATRALDCALALAALANASLHAVAVEEHLPAYAATVGEVDEEVRFENTYFRRVEFEVRRTATSRGVAMTFEILRGHAAEALARAAAAHEADLLVVGHAGHARIRHLLLGSTADRVVEHAPCSVLVVR